MCIPANGAYGARRSDTADSSQATDSDHAAPALLDANGVSDASDWTHGPERSATSPEVSPLRAPLAMLGYVQRFTH
jgi:hypothetical protein